MHDRLTAEEFERRTKSHALEIIRNDGVYRHVRMRRDGTSCEGWDVVTWPGHLCYTGDMGSFLLARTEDMFKFFRHDRINPEYWEEKVLASDREGVREYCEAAAHRAITNWISDQPSKTKRAVAAEILPYLDEGEEYVRRLISDFDNSRDSRIFDDFYEANLTDFTYRFLFCCRAIILTIKKYDEAHEAAHETAGV